MNKKSTFSLALSLRSFRYAWQGIITLLRQERNARLHLIASILALSLALYLGLTSLEWIALVVSISAVWAAELFNTAIEALCDRVSEEKHPLIKTAKDCAAGGVLVLSLNALIIGLILFLPKL